MDLNPIDNLSGGSGRVGWLLGCHAVHKWQPEVRKTMCKHSKPPPPDVRNSPNNCFCILGVIIEQQVDVLGTFYKLRACNVGLAASGSFSDAGV